MADEKVYANGNVQYWWIPEVGLSNPAAPTADEINNNGINITNAISWESSTLPGATESNDIDDRSILEPGTATSRGFAQFEADISFFRPRNVLDTTDDYGQTFNAFRTPGVTGYIVAQILQSTPHVLTPVEAGNWINVFRFQADTFVDETEGEDSVKYSVAFLPQGEVYINTQVMNATPVTITALEDDLTVGDVTVATATLGGKVATQAVYWSSSDPEVATVSQNGVITAVSDGTADITATHPAATGATAPIVVVVSGGGGEGEGEGE